MNGKPKISVVVTAYNLAHTLPRAVESVFAQTYRPLELVVVDDGSIDNTQDLIEGFAGSSDANGVEFRYTQQENQGVSHANNNGVRLSTGEYIVLLDADDRLPPRSIEARVGFLEAHPDKDAVFANTNYINSSGKVYHVRRPKVSDSGIEALRFLGAVKVPFHTASLMYRRRVFDTVGYFDPCISRVQDLEFTFRLLSNSSVGYLDEAVYNYYVDSHNVLARIKNRVYGARSTLRIVRKNISGPLRPLFYLHTLIIQPLKLFYELFSQRK